MANYNKLTVANLKTILKERSIPSTGLTRKQQIIDKLVEHDAQSQPTAQRIADEPPAEANRDKAQIERNDARIDTKHIIANTELEEESGLVRSSEEVGVSSGQGEASAPQDEASINSISAVPEQIQTEPLEPSAHHQTTNPVESEGQDLASQTRSLQATTSTQESPASGLVSDAVPPPPVEAETSGDESRKRKRRSATPPVDAEAVAIKKRKQEQAEPIVHLKEDNDAPIPVQSEGETPDVAMVDVKADVDAATKADTIAAARHDAAAAAMGLASAEEVPYDTTIPAEISDQMAETAKPTMGDPEQEDNASQEETAVERRSEPDREEAILPSTDNNAPIVEHGASTSRQSDEKRKFTSEEPLEPASSSDKSRTLSHSNKDHRYKELFTGSTANARPPIQTQPEKEDEAPDTTPALHPATSALYIRELKRPLKPEDLRAHLISLSTPPNAGSENDESVLEKFYLDSIRSHCFVKLPGVKEASRVRSALHNRVWPAGRDRNALWVDFVPEESVEDWIRAEEDAAADSGRLGGRRWEVIYRDGDDGDIKAVFQEVGPGGSAAPRSAPLGPRGSFAGTRRPSAPVAKVPATNEQSKAFQSLDELFRSTTAKPKLYYLPASQDLVDKRLDEMDRLTSRDAPRRGDRFDEYRRFTYEDGDVLVDAGPHIGPHREAAGRARGGGYRGGYRGGPRYDDGGYRGDRYRSDEPSRGGFGYDRRGSFRR